ncbi:MAG: ABC transporter ATP-binding protein [Candidatus Levyibacteriota bacterium]
MAAAGAASAPGVRGQPRGTGGNAFGAIEEVGKTFRSRDRQDDFVAIEQVSLTFGEGELVSLLGPSGCGKTTLLRIVAGLETRDRGSVRIGGREITGPQRDFGFVFQTPNLMPWRSVLDNVLFPMEILGRRDKAAVARAHELLELVGLGGFARSRPHQLSGGMKQRVSLCRGVIHQPALLLMDEPFGALDELTRMEMHDLLKNIQQVTRATVMFVTHSISEAAYLSDQIVVFTRRPARIAERIRVELPYPRTPALRYTDAFTAIEHRAGAALGIVK